MKLFKNFLLLTTLTIFFTASLYAEENLHLLKWGDLPSLSEYTDVVPLYDNPDWQISVSGENWQKLTIPFYVTDIPEFSVKCTFTYKKNETNNDLYLISYGIKGSARIYLNNSLVHYQPNNYAPFKIKIDKSLLKEQNTFKIVIHNPLKAVEGFPQFVRQFSEKHSLGITRPLFLARKKLNDVEIIKVMLARQNNGFFAAYSYRLNFNTSIPKFKGKVTVEEELLDQDDNRLSIRLFNIDTTSLKNLISSKSKISEDALWSVDAPKWVKLKITLKKNYSQFFQAQKSFALRYLSYRDNRIFLNGQPFIIKGINYYENLTRFNNVKEFNTQLKKDFKFIKDSGFNAVRLPHYLPGKFIVQTADSIGLLLFAELPVQRLPKELFLNDNLLENSISTLNQLAEFYNNNPSFAAVGLGTEIPAHSTAAQKFMLILKGIVANKSNCLSYISPIPAKSLPSERLSDFYILDIYRPLSDYTSNLLPYALAGKIGINNPEIIYQWDADIAGQKHLNFLNQEIKAAVNRKDLNGGFIESFADWQMEYALSTTINSEQPYIFPSGLFTINGDKKAWVDDANKLWQDNSYSGFLNYNINKSTNFFSILLFFTTIFFFAFVRRQYRLRENLKRSIYHPYGFFVDIRERRIIPIFNSILVGIFTTLIIASFLGAYIYYYHDSNWVQEMLSVVFIDKSSFNYYLSISSSPVEILLVISVILLTFPFIISLVLKFFGFFSKEHFRYRQGVAISFWSAIPFLFMLPVSFAAYHLMQYELMQRYLLYIFILFFIWTQFRLINGVRVLFIVKTGKVFTWMFISYFVPLVTFWLLLNPKHFWIEYLKLLFSSRTLF